DGGRTFTQQSDQPRSFIAVAVDPTKADVVYAGTRGGSKHGIMKSIDGGKTFTDLPDTVGSNFGQITIDPSNPQTIYAARRQGGVFKSTNGGANWALAGSLPGGETLGVVVDPQNPAHVFAWIQAQGVFRSNDGGATWAAADTGESLRRSGIEFGHAAMVADPAVAGRVYIGDSGVVQVDTGP